jgi:C-terminal processing protease CtpA/Prc
MITVSKDSESDNTGISLVQYKSEIFVSGVKEGPFYSTAIDRGDKILSINGKKPPKQITTVEQAHDIMAMKQKITMFALRPDPKRDRGYLWVMSNT